MLARLELTRPEKELFSRQLGSILDYINTLNELDTSGIEPTAHVLPLLNVFREDVPGPSLPKAKTLLNAPDKTKDFFRVPRIIE